MEAPPAVLALDIETHDWRAKGYKPTAAEKDQENALRAAQVEEAASKCNAPAGPCPTCRIRMLHPARGQFGHLTDKKPWELTYARVAQLAFVVSDAEGNILQRFERCISDVPGGCSAKATKYHGLTNEQLAREGIPIAEAMRQFGADLRKLDAAGGKLIAHNLEFDAGILRAELERLGDEFAETTALLCRLAKDGVCTLARATDLVGEGKLDTVCDFLGIKTTCVDAHGKKRKPHTAVYDSEIAATLYWRMCLDWRFPQRLRVVVQGKGGPCTPPWYWGRAKHVGTLFVPATTVLR